MLYTFWLVVVYYFQSIINRFLPDHVLPVFPVPDVLSFYVQVWHVLYALQVTDDLFVLAGLFIVYADIIDQFVPLFVTVSKQILQSDPQ